MYCVAVTFKMIELVEQQQICIKFCIQLEHSSMETIQMIQKATAMGNWWLAASTRQHACSCIISCAEFFGKTSNHPGDSAPPHSPDLAPYHFWLFPKLKSPLKGKRFQTIDEIQENRTGQLKVIGRTVWGLKVPEGPLKGPEVSLSYVQCFLSLFQWVSLSLPLSLTLSLSLSSLSIYIYKHTHTETHWGLLGGEGNYYLMPLTLC